MSDQAYLTLMLDAPLMSWGHSSRFQRRTTALHPTRSGIFGMLCAAFGAEKGSAAEQEWLARLEPMRLTMLTIPRISSRSIRRLEDFHTTGGGYDKKTHTQWIPRKASGGPCDNATLSHRQYLLDAMFGVIIEGDLATLKVVAEALQDPQWGIWFGRKSCIPAAPVPRGLAATMEAAMANLGLEGKSVDNFAVVEDAVSFADGTDTLMDMPANFKTREFKPRRILQRPAQTTP